MVTAENSSGDPGGNQAMEYDYNSGRTIAPAGPWIKILRARKQASTQVSHAAISKQRASSPTQLGRSSPDKGPMPNKITQPFDGLVKTSTANQSRRHTLPKLPDNEYKIIYRPRTGLCLSKWSDKIITQGFATAGNVPLRDFYSQVTIQTQWDQNLIVASTASEDLAEVLSTITQLQLEGATYELSAYVKPPPNTSRGVIHGFEAGTTEEELAALLITTGPQILQARMLGRSTTAVVTFEGPHVPFYVKVACTLTRCRPYKRTHQYCSLCGALGHRPDVCPTPDRKICSSCGLDNPLPDHHCVPKCKLCGLSHETASKDCKRRLKPNRPPRVPRNQAEQTPTTNRTSMATQNPPQDREQWPPPSDPAKPHKRSKNNRQGELVTDANQSFHCSTPPTAPYAISQHAANTTTPIYRI
ncbi:hypothetical protein HPB48_023876 [Haemaphysalis longicornis]|uniref:Uncharacterized protein n=1 Tax=Haemaphysalis longicornis TaxID=44386 RepID=A0A9J6H8T1_HAELO|nr:hypothetical protein HPB48_023876 [Haemaphysalis longicornis]